VYDGLVIRTLLVFACLLSSAAASAQSDKYSSLPSFDYKVARTHEIKPRRHAIPVAGMTSGFNELSIRLVVSPTGEVLDAEASGQPTMMSHWPQLRPEVLQWKFTPFERDGKPTAVQVEDYISLLPPERLPKTHLSAPLIRPESEIAIILERTGCFGTCPSYTVTVSSAGIVFEGGGYVVASGNHTESVDPYEVRKFAQKFVAADFYSMDSSYRWSATDLPTFLLSVSIDGHAKKVEDYAGEQVGMPGVVSDLEEEVDAFARTERWIQGSDGLVRVLQTERFDFHSYEAQAMLREAASRGQASTVQEFLEAGVPLTPLTAPKSDQPDDGTRLTEVGWLNAAGEHPEVLQVLINAGASKDDQNDKDLALVGAANAGEVKAVQALIAYGANPNVDPSKLIITEAGSFMTMQGPGAGSVLIYAARSGNPEVVREILFYHPNVEKRDHEGQTAMFAAGDYADRDRDGARVACVRLLAEAGANVNARDNNGNTPLHETFLTDVEAELLRLGANVNARNNDGETPIFTTVDDEAIPLFIAHGADLTIRNNKGETVLEAAKHKGPIRQAALRNAIEKPKPDQPAGAASASPKN
jgi:ankyrin repeat protein